MDISHRFKFTRDQISFSFAADQSNQESVRSSILSCLDSLRIFHLELFIKDFGLRDLVCRL